MFILVLYVRKLRPGEACWELGEDLRLSLLPSVSESLALGSVCSHGPESCSWFKFCPRLVEEHQIPARELSARVHICSHWSKKHGNKQELNQGLGNCQAEMPPTLILLQD